MNSVPQTRDSRITFDFGYYNLFSFVLDMEKEAETIRLFPDQLTLTCLIFIIRMGNNINFVVNCALVQKEYKPIEAPQ